MHSLRIPKPVDSDPVVDDFLDAAKTQNRDVAVIRRSDILDLVKHQHRLAASLQTLQSVSEQQDVDQTSTFRRALSNAASVVEVFDGAIIKLLGWDPKSSVPTAKSSKKFEELLCIPELVEMILLHLQPRDILTCMRVKKAMHGTILTSPKLGVELSLQADSSCGWWSVFDNRDEHPWPSEYRNRVAGSPFAGLTCFLDSVVTEDFHKDEIVGMGLTARLRWPNNVKQHLHPPGLRVRSMLICQPPVKEISVTMNCCGLFRYRDYGVRPLLPQIRCDTGVTVGHLYDMARKVLAEHRLCSFAESFFHDANTGEVRTSVAFRANLPSLVGGGHKDYLHGRAGDLLWRTPSRVLDFGGDWNPEYNGNRAWRTQRYIEAKRHAFSMGCRVPTLEYFEKKIDIGWKHNLIEDIKVELWREGWTTAQCCNTVADELFGLVDEGKLESDDPDNRMSDWLRDHQLTDVRSDDASIAAFADWLFTTAQERWTEAKEDRTKYEPL